MKKRLKVLYVVPIEASIPGSDLGGVIPSSEQIMIGIRELGHEAVFVRLRNARITTAYDTPSRAVYGPEQWVTGAGTGLPMHTVLGWQGPYLTTGDPTSLKEYIDLANSCDVVIWGALFGLKNKYAIEDTSWTKCFTEVKTPTVVMVRDGYMWERAAWSSQVEPYISAWATVHSQGFHLVEGLSRRRGLVFSPHDVSSVPVKTKPLSRRNRSLYMVQNFKACKRSDRLVRAVSHMGDKGISVVLAGNGIELRYMQSVDKCKPAYRMNKRTDVDQPKSNMGKRIWDVAMSTEGFKYLGAQREDERNKSMLTEGFHIDTSKSSPLGMFNRTFIEAAMQGQVTLTPKECISGVAPVDNIWCPGEHYLPIPQSCTPLQLAEAVDNHFSISNKTYAEIVSNVRAKLPMFDRSVCAKQLIDLALGNRPTCLLFKEKGVVNKNLVELGRSELIKVFGDVL